MSRSRSSFIPSALVALALAAASFAAPGSAAKPNIVFIFADDQCHDTIRALGNEEIITPNLDWLVARGTTFSNAYNMGGWSGAICVASRTMLQTGRSLWRAQAAAQDLAPLAKQRQFWPQLLKRAGYETYMTGKWHVAIPAGEVYDTVAHIRGGMPAQTEAGYGRPRDGKPDPWSPHDPAFGGFWEGGKHWSEVVADDAAGFIARAATREAPFFMFLAFNAPHDPRQSPKRFTDLYLPEKIKLPESFIPQYPYKQEIGCYILDHKDGKPVYQRDENLAPWPRTPHAVRVNRQEYYAIITHMDEQIGRILDALEASGKADKSYIFFSADHGLSVGHHGLIGKQNMYEHSLRVPFVAVGPGIPRGERRTAPIYVQDIMPTTLEIAGVPVPPYVEFNSLLPAIREPRRAGNYPAVYGAFLKDKQRMIRVGDFKLIVYPEARVVRLFDLARDPNEVRDLAREPAQQQRVRQLFQKLIELQHSFDDPLDLRAAFPTLG